MPARFDGLRLVSNLLSLRHGRSFTRPARLTLAVLGGFALLSACLFVMTLTQTNAQAASSSHLYDPVHAGVGFYTDTTRSPFVTGDPGPSDDADLAVDKTVSESRPRPGDTIIYTITVTNKGPHEATSVQLSDRLPEGIHYITHTTSQGVYTDSVWKMEYLADSEIATLIITAIISATVDPVAGCERIVNTADELSADQSDLEQYNNQASAVITPISVAYTLYLPIIFKNYEPLICSPFFDDFSDSESGWRTVNDEDAQVDYSADREFFIRRKSSGMRIVQAPVSFTNRYTVEVDARWDSTNVGYEYGLIFGQANYPTPTYRFGVDPVNQTYRLKYHDGSRWECINQTDPCWVGSSSITNTASSPNHLKVECEGKTITLYVNGNPLWERSTGIPSCAGHVGLFAQSSSTAPRATAYFDNFRVSCPLGIGPVSVAGSNVPLVPIMPAELNVDE